MSSVDRGLGAPSESASRPLHSELITPNRFLPERHFYPRVLNAELHPMVRFFMTLSTDRIVHRFRHLNPQADADALAEILRTPTQLFHWAGADLMYVTDPEGRRQMVVIETNSCPSGQKSMPIAEDHLEQGAYRKLIETAFLPRLQQRRGLEGGLAMIYDKNYMEASGYAAALADATREPVHLVYFGTNDADPAVRFEADGLMAVRSAEGAWVPIRGALRYVTQRPWTRIPQETRTLLLNPITACLAGGRNKLVAATAYELFNQKYGAAGLDIRTPMTIRDVALQQVPLWFHSMGGKAVVKVPYANAGQGVYTLTSEAELEHFMAIDHPYNRFIVQSLIGNSGWSSTTSAGTYYHVGTMPDRHGHTYVTDLRMMVCSGPEGFQPLVLYARRAREPLTNTLGEGASSWDMLGTNLSYRRSDGSWDTEPNRLMLMDRKDFNLLGLGIDALIEAFVQTCMATRAIDDMAQALTTTKGKFRHRLFATLNEDPTLIEEIYR